MEESDTEQLVAGIGVSQNLLSLREIISLSHLAKLNASGLLETPKTKNKPFQIKVTIVKNTSIHVLATQFRREQNQKQIRAPLIT